MAAFIFILTACGGNESKDNAENNKIPENSNKIGTVNSEEKCVKEVSNYYECLRSLEKFEFSNSSPKKQKCDNQLKQSLETQKLDNVINSIVDDWFYSLLAHLGDEEVPEEIKQIVEKCKKYRPDLKTHDFIEKKKSENSNKIGTGNTGNIEMTICIYQEHIKTACEKEFP